MRLFFYCNFVQFLHTNIWIRKVEGEKLFMKKKLLVLFSALTIALGFISINQDVHIFNNPQIVNASRRKIKRYNDRHKVWTNNYIIVGNRRSHIYHVKRGANYRMNRGNVVIFKTEAAARAAGYRKSLR